MPRDTQIFSGADHAGNSDYTLPGNSEIEVLAVNANFKDNGAGADWCPAVVMFSDSGHVIARAMLPDVKVTAGGDAEVSFFPGVKPGAAATGGFTPAYAQVTKAGLGVIGPGTVGVTWPSLSTNDSSVFELNPADHTKVSVKKDGVYLLSGFMLMTTQPTSFTTGAYMFADTADVGGGSIGTSFGEFWRFDDATAGDPKEVTAMHGEDYTNLNVPGGTPYAVRCFFQLGQAVNIGAATMTLTRLTGTGF